MSEFEDLRGKLGAVRRQRDELGTTLATQKAELERVRRALARAARAGNREEQAELEAQQTSLKNRFVEAKRRHADRRADAAGLLAELSALADPTRLIERLSDRVPILLFPLRIETRFHAGTGPNGDERRELWIRVYPDTCQVDTFEPLLRESELDALRSFWIALFRSGGVEAQERGAWSALVGGLGSGRAAYAIGQFSPTNLAAKPSKSSANDVILVIAPTMTVTPTEQSAAFAYWLAVWAADGDAKQEQLALSALRTAVGNARAEQIREDFAPNLNGWDPPAPLGRTDVGASCAVLLLPPPPVATQTSWSRAPTAAALPDRLVALLYNAGEQARAPLIGAPIPDDIAVGPDPTLPVEEQIGIDNDDLRLNEDLRWLADFDKAVELGMGFRVALSAEEATRGFDRLLIVGLRLSADEQAGKRALETLIEHQSTSKGGYGFVPQGSPTNNTESSGAAHTWIDDAAASFDRIFKGAEAYVESSDPLERRDGEWFAQALGIDGKLVKTLPHAAGRDQLEARAMNVALWNGTLGYGLEELLLPVVSRPDIGQTRLFFTRFVTGRGPLPAVRVGKQPYGVLPTLAFSRYRQSQRDPAGGNDYLSRLHGVLLRMAADWSSMAASAAYVGKPGNRHQILLDIVGLHPTSAEYHQRYAKSFDQLYNQLTFELGSVLGQILATWLGARGRELLERLGADPEASPAILEKFFYGTSPLLKGPVVDDVPLSESSAVRASTADGKNYLEWLAGSSLDVIRRQDFGGKPAPTALLYLMLRHSMLLGQWDAGLRFLENRALIDSATARLEPAFIHVQATGGGKSKFEPLIQTAPAITGNATTTLAEYVLQPSILQAAPETADLREIVAALERLKKTPTARLERVFVEHVDCVTYRLDAWKTAFAAARLAELRDSVADDQKQGGLYLGAFGWVENVCPKPAALRPVRLNDALRDVFERPTDAPLHQDPSNAGFIHAPSLNHAATAAILKNAYRVNASQAKPDVMAINLSSQRVQQALSILDGIRNGQPLAALLGYRFERGLHDEHALAEVDKFIYPLRQVFPLVANKLKATEANEDITLLEARNVIDGKKLVERVLMPGRRKYPFGFPLGSGVGELLPASALESQAIDREVDRLLDVNDALGDLVLSESVYQVVRGNFERAAAATNALLEGGQPPEPEVVQTPRSGLSLEHRVALHLDPSVPLTSPSSVPMTPRATAEAPLNRWLAGRLPAPTDVVVKVDYSTPAAAVKSVILSQRDLGLQPLDLLYLGELELEQAQGELDDRIAQLVRFGADAHPGMTIDIRYLEPVAGKVTLFELAPLIRSLRVLVLKSRALQLSDSIRPLEAEGGEVAWDDGELGARVAAAITALTLRRDALMALEVAVTPLDEYVATVSAEFLRTAAFGIPETSAGALHADLKAIFDAIATKIRAAVERLVQRAADYQALMDTWPTLTDEAARFAMLKSAELLVMATGTLAPPALAADYKALIEGEKLTFDSDLPPVQALRSWNGSKLRDFVNAVLPVMPRITLHDPTPFDISDQQNAMTTLRALIAARVAALHAELTRRIDEANTLGASTASVSDSAGRVQLLLQAAKLVLGEEARLIPRFTLPNANRNELAQCLAASPALLTDLSAAGRRFPVDDWLYGVARVREKMFAWENASVLAEAFGALPAELTPLQLPFLTGDRWMALEFDTATAKPLDRLLYTAHFATSFDPAKPQCGLLLDAWPEIVPSANVTSGLTFHFDRPNAEPPQVLLLAVPPVLRGHWTFDDLVATLLETLQGAKERAVEPAHVDASAYGQLLPATMMAVTLYGITIATNLAQNNHIYELIRGE